MPTREEAEAILLAPGAPFELVWEDVLGERMQVFRQRAPSLRALVERSTAFGGAEYVVFGDRRITFAEHARRVASVAAALRERFGVAKGDRVAVLAANCPEWIVTFWASVSLGAIAVGLNGWWTGDEIRYGLGDARPAVLVADQKRLARLEGADPGMPVVEIESGFGRLWDHDPDAPLPPEPIAEDDPALILYTSGTTGRPKGAVLSHRSLIAFLGVTGFSGARTMMSRPPAPPDEVQHPPCLFVTSPLFHVSGMHSAALIGLANGVRSVWNVGRFDPVTTMQTIARERVTNWGAMNTLVHRLMHHPEFGRYDLSSLRNIGSGGAPTAPELQRRMRAAFPSTRGDLGHGYGSTETGALATLTGGDEWAAFPDAVGRPVPTVQVEIHAADGRVLPEGDEGEVCVRSPLVMLGYWNRPEETAETLGAGRWLRTGDVGRMLGGRLYLASRKRDLVIRGGENVYPVEIENRLAEHPDVEEAAVLGVAHEELGQEVKAIVVPRPGTRLDPTELAAFVGATLAYFKVPTQWEIRREPLPRNASGKVLKHVLAGEAENAFVPE